jgi:hypothetical protein
MAHISKENEMVLGAMFYGLIVVAYAFRMGGLFPRPGRHRGLVEMIGAKIKRGIAK